MGDEAELFALRNAVYLGNYQAAISEALSINPSSEAVRVSRDFFMYRAYVELGQYRVVMDEVGHGAPAAVQAVKLLATYLGGARDAKDMVLLQLKEWLSDPQSQQNWQLLLVAGMVYLQEQDYKEALKHLHQNAQLDVMALVAQIYLAMHRVDLARKQVAAMQEQDDDATLSKLSGAWVAIAEGGDKYQDALYEFQELGEKYSMSLTLLNAMALCNLHMGRFEEAERLLQDALAKSSADPNTLANLVVCMQHMRKPPDVVSRYTNQLKALAPAHPWVAKQLEMEAMFDRSSAQFSKA